MSPITDRTTLNYGPQYLNFIHKQNLQQTDPFTLLLWILLDRNQPIPDPLSN